jgi:valyl-tRNA synthetase
MNIKPSQEIKILVESSEKAKLEIIKFMEREIKFLANISDISIGEHINRPEHSATFVTDNIEIFIPLEGLIDFEKEKERITGKLSDMEKELSKVNKKLENKNFMEKAKPEAVAKVKEKAASLKEDIELYRKNLNSL